MKATCTCGKTPNIPEMSTEEILKEMRENATKGKIPFTGGSSYTTEDAQTFEQRVREKVRGELREKVCQMKEWFFLDAQEFLKKRDVLDLLK